MHEQKKLKILMLEDSEDDASLIEHVLRKEKLPFINERVDTREEFTEAMARFKPDVVLSDHGLPGFNSREALKICLKEGLSTPFILVTGTVTDAYAISCLREGADDYILKGNLSRLPLAIMSAVKKRKLERLKREARHALRRQNSELLKVNKELDNFVYSVSHNLRGPLASVMGLLNLAKQEHDRMGIDSLHTMMESSMDKLDETLNEILEFSKNARNDVLTEKIEWPELIDATLRKLEYLDRNNELVKLIDIQTNAPFYSDAGRLRTILTNVLSNTFHFRDRTRESIVGIEIRGTKCETVITVKDNGIGISEQVLPRVFEMFYRGNEGSKGAGLGLYITREIVDKLQGKLAIQSVPNMGSTVIITIPNRVVPNKD